MNKVRAEWHEVGRYWAVTVPDVPGAISQSAELDQVRTDAAEVIGVQTHTLVDPVSLDIEWLVFGTKMTELRA